MVGMYEIIVRQKKHYLMTFMVAQLVKNLLVMQEIWVQSLGWKDHL